MPDIWFTSDTHFSHKNIIKYSERPFKDTDEMDEVLIANWNSIVKPNDIIYHLGDLAFCGVNKTQEIVDRLNGHKYLRLGNHDKATVTRYKKYGFEQVFTYDFLMYDIGVLFSHYPVDEQQLESYTAMRNMGHKNVHGHTHSEVTGLDPNLFKCICVELTDYKPIHIDEIIQWAKA
jgi:calcineurin-like phosphoesterase family protein